MSQSLETKRSAVIPALERLEPRMLALAGAAIAGAAYVAALISQYGFDWRPCELCLWQRVPYLVGLGVAAPALLFTRAPAWLLYGAAALAFLAGVGLAGYHSLVEFGVLEGLASCGSDTISAASSFEAFVAETEGETPVTCGSRTPFLFGLTMTNWNLLVSLGIAGLFAQAAWASRAA